MNNEFCQGDFGKIISGKIIFQAFNFYIPLPLKKGGQSNLSPPLHNKTYLCRFFGGCSCSKSDDSRFIPRD